MKKIVFLAFLLAVCAAAGSAQESRQDISLSGTTILQPFRSSSTDVQASAQRGFGALLSYRFMLTPSSALEANYGITYQYKLRYLYSNTANYPINNRTQEVSFAYVHSFNYRKFNPFIEGGGGVLIFLPVRDQTTGLLDAKQQVDPGALYGAGIAYEVSPSFDIRAEYRGFVTRVPNFGVTSPDLNLKRWYNIYYPAVGAAYHF